MFLIILGILSSLFVIGHIGLSSKPVRSSLIDKLGEKAFMAIYSLISFITLGGAIFVYAKFDTGFPILWVMPSYLSPIIYILMFVSFLLFFLSMANPSPVGMAPMEIFERTLRVNAPC